MLKKKRKRPQKRIPMWSALPPYLGGKRRLCPLIFRELDQLIPRKYWFEMTFLDGFLGGGSVSLYAKAQGFKIISTDIAQRSIVVGKSLIENSRVKLTKEDTLLLASTRSPPPGRVEIEYVPKVFTKEQGRFLDNVFNVASQAKDETKAALYKLLAIRVMLLAHPMSQVRKGTIHRLETGEYENITESCLKHYIDGWKLVTPKKLWDLAQQINAGVFQGEGQVINNNVMDTLPTLNPDIAYFDPPYPGVMSYEKEYQIIDELLEGISRPTSPFTAKDGASIIDVLFSKALHIPVWILSLGNAVVTIDELEEKMTRLGRSTNATQVCYQHLGAVATEEKNKTNKEFLVLGWDADALQKKYPQLNFSPTQNQIGDAK